jgi:hypothetical protein
MLGRKQGKAKTMIGALVAIAICVAIAVWIVIRRNRGA